VWVCWLFKTGVYSFIIATTIILVQTKCWYMVKIEIIEMKLVWIINRKILI